MMSKQNLKQVSIQMVFILTIILFLSSSAETSSYKSEDILKFLHPLQAVIILIFLFVLVQWGKGAFSENDPNLPKSEIAKICFKQFSYSWLTVWISWFILYAWNTVISISNYDKWWAKFGTDATNVLSTTALFFCYLVLDKPSVKTETAPKRSKHFWRSLSFVITLSFLILIMSLFARYSNKNTTANAANVAIIINSIYAGLGIIFLSGRLDSHIIQLGRAWIAALYCYGLVQVFYGFHDNIGDLILPTYILVMLLKIIFFLVILFLITNRSLANYLDESVANYEIGPRSSIFYKKMGIEYNQPAFVKLSHLLTVLFNEEELRRLPNEMPISVEAALIPISRDNLVNAMPVGKVSQITLAYTLAEAIHRRGLASTEFFEYLKKVRSNRSIEISTVMRLFEKADK